jgi:hypothetical protein
VIDWYWDVLIKTASLKVLNNMSITVDESVYNTHPGSFDI